MSRVNPFNDLADFAPKTQSKPVEAGQIEQLAQESGFPSRQPVTVPKASPATAVVRPRRRTTGRNQQINVKATAETIARFYRLADERQAPLGEVLDQALAALEKADASRQKP